REALAIHGLAAKVRVPYGFPAGPEIIAVGMFFAGFKLRPADKSFDILAAIGERKARGQIGSGFDIVGLKPVIGIHIVGMLTDDRPDDMDGRYSVGSSDFADLCPQPAIVSEKLIHLGIFRFIS